LTEDRVIDDFCCCEFDSSAYLVSRAAKNHDHLVEPGRQLCLSGDPSE
jgi:hypothetical protein